MNIFDLQVQSKIIESIHRHMFLILLILVGAFVGAQFMILATVGTKGAEITTIRAQKDVLRIENESLRSEIDRARTLGEIQPEIEELFDLSETQVETLYAVGYSDDQRLGSLP